MTWRGALRSMAAAQRRAERAAAQRHRALAQQHKAAAKHQALADAADEAERYAAYVAAITSVHVDCGPVWDWQALREAAPPVAPALSRTREQGAMRARAAYEPGFLDKVLRRADGKRRALDAAIAAAQRADAAAHTAALAAHADAHQDWAARRELAGRILGGDRTAYRDAVEALSPFAELSELGSNVTFVFPADPSAAAQVDATLHVNGDAVIPAEARTLLQSGKLSVKKLPAGQFYALYQDYVAGAVFRVARELFALLPVDAVTVTAVTTMLDTSSGHLAEQPILTALLPRSTLARLRWEPARPVGRAAARGAPDGLPEDQRVPTGRAAIGRRAHPGRTFGFEQLTLGRRSRSPQFRSSPGDGAGQASRSVVSVSQPVRTRRGEPLIVQLSSESRRQMRRPASQGGELDASQTTPLT